MIRLLFIILFIPEVLLANLNFGKDLSFETFDEDGFKKSLSKAIFEDNGWPENHVRLSIRPTVRPSVTKSAHGTK